MEASLEQLSLDNVDHFAFDKVTKAIWSRFEDLKDYMESVAPQCYTDMKTKMDTFLNEHDFEAINRLFHINGELVFLKAVELGSLDGLANEQLAADAASRAAQFPELTFVPPVALKLPKVEIKAEKAKKEPKVKEPKVKKEPKVVKRASTDDCNPPKRAKLEQPSLVEMVLAAHDAGDGSFIVDTQSRKGIKLTIDVLNMLIFNQKRIFKPKEAKPETAKPETAKPEASPSTVVEPAEPSEEDANVVGSCATTISTDNDIGR